MAYILPGFALIMLLFQLSTWRQKLGHLRKGTLYTYTVSQEKTWSRTFCDNFINTVNFENSFTIRNSNKLSIKLI